MIRLNQGGTILILSRHDARRSHERPNDKQNKNDDQNDSPRNDKRINDAPFNKPHTIRTARTVTIPPMSQVAIPVVTKASGLVYIEPKLPVQTRYHVRRTNGIHEVRPNFKFELVLANFRRTRNGYRRELLSPTQCGILSRYPRCPTKSARSSKQS